ncbi:hypothetical protein [Minisyncoccus archaeiphilus]|uniref:hypothetical protein n=1 Tax=Minisyncoccus archaeiphilus TaxID=3238481 RepID=UPI00399CE4B7
MKDKGLTMIEIIFYLAISAIVFLASFSALNIINQSKVRYQVISEVEYQGGFVMESILRSIRHSEQVISPVVGGQSSALSLDMLEALDDPTLYGLTGTSLTVKEGSASTVILTNPRVIISNLVFNNYSALPEHDSIRVSFTITYYNESGKQEYDYSKTFYGTASTRTRR